MNLLLYDELCEKLNVAVERGNHWMASHLSSEGRFQDGSDDLASYYKSVLFFPIVGNIKAGGRSLQYIKSHLTNSDNELCSTSGQKTSLERMQRNLANYMDAWIGIGAWLLGDYTFARCVAEHLKQFLASHGGVATGPIKWAKRERYDLATAASCGRAFLHLGYRAEAIQVSDFLIQALKRQTQSSGILQLSFASNWTFSKLEDPSESTYYCFDPSKRGEKVWFPAFCSAFLCELSQAIADSHYIDAAIEYYKFIQRTPEFHEGTLGNGKSAWAAALLFQSTGDTDYLDAFHHIVPNVLERQQPDGEFGSSGSKHSEHNLSDIPMPRRYERTAEFTTWCATYLRILAIEGKRMEACI